MTTVTDALDEPAAEAAPPRRRRWRYPSLPGLWTALAFACASFTPSLLPRPHAYQGMVVGITAAIGYGLGVLGAAIWREFADRGPRDPAPRSWRALQVAAPVALLVAFLLGVRWQAQLRDLMGIEEATARVLLLPLVAVLVFTGLVGLGRVLRGLYRRAVAWLSGRVGARAARAVGFLLVAGGTWVVVSGILLDGFVAGADRAFSLRDTGTHDDAFEPTSPLRSGSPESLIAWDSLGRQGRGFTGRGPTAADIESVTGAPASEPIRIFAGLGSADDVEARADLAVRDLERAGGFDRTYLLVATTTGSGWLEPTAMAGFEYVVGGDSATVAIQYSYLPSWISYLVDQERAREAGRQLFDAVYERWLALPADTRPQLLVFGESLGSFGAETAFSGEFDLANRTAGALLVGPPSFNPLYREFVDGRDPATPEIEPVFRDGRTVRFTARPGAAIAPTDRPWDGTRVLYLQHPSDPIVWWGPHLLFRRPDWLGEPVGADVLDRTVWLPIVTFWQLTLDLPRGMEVPPGHGHVYSGEHVDGWAQVLQPDGWTEARSQAIRAAVLGDG